MDSSPIWAEHLDRTNFRVPTTPALAYNAAKKLHDDIDELRPVLAYCSTTRAAVLPRAMFARDIIEQLVENITRGRVCSRCTCSHRFCRCTFVYHPVLKRLVKTARVRPAALMWGNRSADFCRCEGRYRTNDGFLNQLGEFAREALLAADEILMKSHILRRDTWRSRSLWQKLRKYSVLNEQYRNSKKVIYIALQPHCKKSYVGMSGQGFDKRVTQHWRAAFVGTTFFYCNSRDFFRYYFLPIVHLPEQTTRAQVLAIESNLIAEFNATENTTQAVRHTNRFLHSEALCRGRKRPRLFARRRDPSRPRDATCLADLHLLARVSDLTRTIIFFARRHHLYIPRALRVKIEDKPHYAAKLLKRAKNILEEQEHTVFMQNMKEIARAKIVSHVVEVGDTAKTPAFWDLVRTFRAAYKSAPDAPPVNLCFKARRGPLLVDVFKRTNEDYHHPGRCSCRCADLVREYPALGEYLVEGHVVCSAERFCSATHTPLVEAGRPVGTWNARCRFLSSATTAPFLTRCVEKFCSLINTLKPTNTKDVIANLVEHYERDGIRESCTSPALADIGSRLSADVVDKEVDVSLVCPLVLTRITKRHLGGLDPLPGSTYRRVHGWQGLQRDNCNSFWHLRPRTNLEPRKDHHWGFLRTTLKKKTFKIFNEPPERRKLKDLAYRPILSYAKHYYGPIYQFASRVVNEILELDPELSRHFFTKTADVLQFIKNAERMATAAGEQIGVCACDVKDFFTNCDLDEALVLIRDAIAKLKRETGAVWARATKLLGGHLPIFHGKSRDYIVQKGKRLQRRVARITFTKRKPSKNLYNYIHLDDLAGVLKHDADHCYLRALGHVFSQEHGAPMGSYTSTPFSNAYALYHEVRKGKFAHESARRWCDDKLCVYFVNHGPPSIMSRGFYPGCELIPDSDDQLVYTGLNIRTNGDKSIDAVARLTGKPIASVFSAGIRRRQRGIVRGHLTRLRLSSTTPPIEATLGILDQLQQQGYDPRILRQEATHFLNCMREEYGEEGCGFAAAGS